MGVSKALQQAAEAGRLYAETLIDSRDFADHVAMLVAQAENDPGHHQVVRTPPQARILATLMLSDFNETIENSLTTQDLRLMLGSGKPDKRHFERELIAQFWQGFAGFTSRKETRDRLAEAILSATEQLIAHGRLSA
jgi:hypothetical protein